LGQQTDISVLRRVFPARNVEVIVGDVAQVAYTLRRARLSGYLVGASPDDGESGKPEFRIEAAAGHRLVYETEGEMREASGLTLYHNDIFELDNRWRLRYVNHGSRPRYEAEAAR
jgi:hypothetical protein